VSSTGTGSQKMRMDANCGIDSRRDGRLRVPHTTPARRPHEDNYRMPRRARRLTTRPRSSWLSTATRQHGVNFRDVWVVGNLWAVFFSFSANRFVNALFNPFGKMPQSWFYLIHHARFGWLLSAGKKIVEARASAVYKPSSCMWLIGK
jgi:hypothetical protein